MWTCPSASKAVNACRLAFLHRPEQAQRRRQEIIFGQRDATAIQAVERGMRERRRSIN
jgi:hypothetical protein